MKRIARIGLGIALGLATLAGGATMAQQQQQQLVQMADPDFAPATPAMAVEEGAPVIAIDEAHGNFHTLTGRFAPFAMLARHGGYRVVASNSALDAEYLVDIDILVIANAFAREEGQDFGEEEIEAIAGWVEQGGSLFLLADHAPFGDTARPLGARFGVGMGGGYVVAGERERASGNINYPIQDPSAHPIFAGSGEARRVGQVRLSLGQSLTAPDNAHVLLALPEGAVELPDRAAIASYQAGEREGTDVSGLPQALAIRHGEGRVVISAEAGMFSAQRVMRGDEVLFRFGLGSFDNEAYALNILDWLAGRID